MLADPRSSTWLRVKKAAAGEFDDQDPSIGEMPVATSCLRLLAAASAAAASSTGSPQDGDNGAPHACATCGSNDAAGCASPDSSDSDFEKCTVKWPTASTPGYSTASEGFLGRGTDYVGGGDLAPVGGKSASVHSAGECCQLCLEHPDCRVWVTTEPATFCWLKAWHPGGGAANGVQTHKAPPGSPPENLRWSGLSCQCDASCTPAMEQPSSVLAALVLVGAAVYLVGGAIYRKRLSPQARGEELLLHHRELTQLWGLVMDGVALCRSGGSRSAHRRQRGSGADSSKSHPGGAREPLVHEGGSSGLGGEKKSKKSSKKGNDGGGGSKRKAAEREGKGGGSSAGSGREVAQPPPPSSSVAANSTMAAASAGAAAGGGGRWVHVV